MPLVEALETAQVGRNPIGGDGSVLQAVDGGRVIVVAGVVHVGSDDALGNQGRLFDVAVGDVALGVVVAGDPIQHVFWERRAPQDRRLLVGKERATHAVLAGVGGA